MAQKDDDRLFGAGLAVLTCMTTSSVGFALAWYSDSPSAGAVSLGFGVWFAFLTLTSILRWYFELGRKYD